VVAAGAEAALHRDGAAGRRGLQSVYQEVGPSTLMAGRS
jgi:hypothetical protein